MTEIKKIKRSIAQSGHKAYESVKNSSGAYVMRGNAIVHVKSNGSIEVIKRTAQVRVKVKDSDRVIII